MAMYSSTGVLNAAEFLISAPLAIQASIIVILGVALLVWLDATKPNHPDSPVSLPGLVDVLHIVPFFRQRFDFLRRGFEQAGQDMFQFNLLRNNVVAVRGHSARKAFFSTPHFDLTSGFAILSGAIPMIKGVTANLDPQSISTIHRRLGQAQAHAPLSELIPQILEDTRRVMEGWGTAGTFDPFVKVYELIFQTTVRSLTCAEIADDPDAVARLKALYDTLDEGTTPATVLMPWLPTPAMIKKLWATKKVYDIVVDAIAQREKSGIAQTDSLQMLLDAGDDRPIVVGFIIGLIIAGARATGTSASWLVTFLGAHTEWRDKAVAEVKTLLERYPLPPAQRTESLSVQMSAIPLSAWENEAPVLDALIRETLRLAQPHTAMRKNLGPDTYIGDNLVPSGAYVIYPLSDIHLNPEVYADPWRFDPSRQPVDGKLPYAYVGWGGGKTTCLGTRLAKVELRLVIAMFVLGFEHDIVNVSGNKVDVLPSPNWNDTLLARPPIGSANVRYRRHNVVL